MNKIIKILSFMIAFVPNVYGTHPKLDAKLQEFEREISVLNPQIDILNKFGKKLVDQSVNGYVFTSFLDERAIESCMNRNIEALRTTVRFLCRSRCIKPKVMIRWTAHLGNEKFACMVIEEYMNNGMPANAYFKRVRPKIFQDGCPKDIRGESMLSIFSRYKMAAVVEMLLQRGADVNAISEHGYTALSRASSQSQNIECLELLLRYGANPELGIDPRKQPIMVAAERGLMQECKILARRYADNESYLQLLCKQRGHLTRWDAMFRDIVVRRLADFELEKACSQKDGICPICFSTFEELSIEHVNLLACCLQPICTGCKALLEVRHLDCPMCRSSKLQLQ